MTMFNGSVSHFDSCRLLPILAAAILFSGAGPVHADISQGLVAYYPFDDGTATDHSGHGRDGLMHNGVASTPGVVGLGAYFDGNDDWIAVDLPLTGTDWAVATWFRIDDFDPGYTDWYEIICNPAQNIALGSDAVHRDLRNWCSGSPTTTAANILQPGALHHVVFQNSGGTTSIHMDGMLMATGGACPSPSNFTNIGQWAPGHPSAIEREPFFGMMDEFRVYDRALTEQEIDILSDMNATPNEAKTWGQMKTEYR